MLNLSVTIIIFFSLLKTFYYGLYEIKQKKNKFGGIFIIILCIVSLIFSALFIYKTK